MVRFCSFIVLYCIVVVRVDIIRPEGLRQKQVQRRLQLGNHSGYHSGKIVLKAFQFRSERSRLQLFQRLDKGLPVMQHLIDLFADRHLHAELPCEEMNAFGGLDSFRDSNRRLLNIIQCLALCDSFTYREVPRLLGSAGQDEVTDTCQSHHRAGQRALLHTEASHLHKPTGHQQGRRVAPETISGSRAARDRQNILYRTSQFRADQVRACIYAERLVAHGVLDLQSNFGVLASYQHACGLPTGGLDRKAWSRQCRDPLMILDDANSRMR